MMFHLLDLLKSTEQSFNLTLLSVTYVATRLHGLANWNVFKPIKAFTYESYLPVSTVLKE